MNLKSLFFKYIAIELTAGLLAMTEFIILSPIIAYLKFHTLMLFPFYIITTLIPKSFKLPKKVWNQGVSEIWATILLVVVTIGMAIVLYVLLSYYAN